MSILLRCMHIKAFTHFHYAVCVRMVMDWALFAWSPYKDQLEGFVKSYDRSNLSRSESFTDQITLAVSSVYQVPGKCSAWIW